MVYPAAGLIDYFSGDHLVLMNATPTSADAHADLIVRDPVAHTFDQVMAELREKGGHLSASEKLTPGMHSNRTRLRVGRPPSQVLMSSP